MIIRNRTLDTISVDGNEVAPNDEIKILAGKYSRIEIRSIMVGTVSIQYTAGKASITAKGNLHAREVNPAVDLSGRIINISKVQPKP